jgi:phosphatidylserine decarboxylase
MVRDGIPWVATPILVAIIPIVFGYWLLAIPLLALAGFMAFFFRDPHRTVPTEPGVVVAPADGRVTIVRLADGQENPESLVSIFLSPLDVHINRSPIGGEIRDIAYKTGKFVMATREDARLLNEQNTLTIQGDGRDPGPPDCLLEADGGQGKMRRAFRHDKVRVSNGFTAAGHCGCRRS